jgi:hypothetical protein
VLCKDRFAAELVARGRRFHKMLTLAGYEKKEDCNWSIGSVHDLTTSDRKLATEVLGQAEMG